MILYEIKKIIKMKVFIFPLLFIMGYLIYLMTVNGEFGYDYADNPFIVVHDKGKEYYGEEAYIRNKKEASEYAGQVNDDLLKQIHKKYMKQGLEDYNTTYSFFDKTFKIADKEYLKKKDVWRDMDITYGFTGDWEEYNSILKGLFSVYALAVVAIAAPLFTYEKENNMTQLICTSKNGGEKFLSNKIRAVAILLNAFLAAVLIMIIIVHFAQYGFSGWDVSIQCSVRGEFVNTDLSCNMAQYALLQILSGFFGCNVLMVTALFISILCNDSLNSLLVAVFGNWALSYPVIHFAVKSNLLDTVLSVLPANIASVSTLITVISSWGQLYCLWGMQILIFIFILKMMSRTWKTKRYYQEVR